MRFTRWIVSCGLLLVLATLWAGCSGKDTVRSRLWVVKINDNQSLNSDVYNAGSDVSDPSDDFVVQDEVEVVIQNDPIGSGVSVEPGGPYSFFTIDSYDVRYESDESIAGFSGALGWAVETGSSVTGAVTVVPAAQKMVNPLVALRQGGEIQATAHVTFHAHEADSGHELKFETSFPIHFANWTD
jgi:hypothetical protein